MEAGERDRKYATVKTAVDMIQNNHVLIGPQWSPDWQTDKNIATTKRNESYGEK